jgi:hypothetical protein
MIVIVWPPSMYFEIRGEKVQVLFSQEMADLARLLAINPKLVDRLDTETMTLEEDGYDSQRRDTES